MWGWGVLVVMGPIMREQLYGVYSTKDPKLLLIAYVCYLLLMPLTVILRVVRTPVFTANKVKRE